MGTKREARSKSPKIERKARIHGQADRVVESE